MFFQEGAAVNTWQQLFDDPLVNTSGAICLYCGSNNNPTMGWFVDALKTSIINGLAFRGLCETNCENNGATLMDNILSLLRSPDASSPNSSTSLSKETLDHVPKSFHVVRQVQKDTGAEVHGDVEVFPVAYFSGSTARQVPCGVSCDACKTCLTSQELLSTSVFIYSKTWL
jgi:hypothetical protein